MQSLTSCSSGSWEDTNAERNVNSECLAPENKESANNLDRGHLYGIFGQQSAVGMQN